MKKGPTFPVAMESSSEEELAEMAQLLQNKSNKSVCRENKFWMYEIFQTRNDYDEFPSVSGVIKR